MDLRLLVKDSLLELSSYVERAVPEIEMMANYTYSGVEEKAIEKIPMLVEGLQWISEVLNHAKPFNSNSLPIEHGLSNLNECLKEIEEALESQDWILFADLLQYQLIPLLNQISQIALKADVLTN